MVLAELGIALEYPFEYCIYISKVMLVCCNVLDLGITKILPNTPVFHQFSPEVKPLFITLHGDALGELVSFLACEPFFDEA